MKILNKFVGQANEYFFEKMSSSGFSDASSCSSENEIQQVVDFEKKVEAKLTKGQMLKQCNENLVVSGKVKTNDDNRDLRVLNR